MRSCRLLILKATFLTLNLIFHSVSDPRFEAQYKLLVLMTQQKVGAAQQTY